MTSDLPETPPDEFDASALAAAVSPSTGDAGANAGGIDNYIASLHLERSNTRATTPSTLQRRKTLMKQASDPTADQEALELEIRQVERLASLLGRRQTKFDAKRGRPTVNHDLDATLEGFFEVQDDENERVADILLSGTHSATTYSMARDDLGGGAENPELKHANIRSAPATLIATQFEPEYGQAVDLFDRIDEMHLTKSPSGSAEYLPLDCYNSEGNKVGATSSSRVARGKAADIADQDFTADSPISDDGVLAGITRSSTWKRQSLMLIQERDRLGPALPQLPNDLDEDDEQSEEEKPYGATANPSTLPENLPVAVAPAPLAPTLGASEEGAPSMEDAFVTGMYPTDAPNTAVVTDYFDILDFIDAKEHSDIEAPRDNSDDDDDGHISSDLLANSNSSDSSDIDLSCDDSSDSGDSDDQYLSKIGPQRMLRVANVVDAPRPHTSHHARHVSSGSSQQPIDSVPVVDQRFSVIVPDAEVNSGAGLASHSTLRRNRRILTKGKSIRRGSLNRQSTRAQSVVPTQPEEASLNLSIPESRPLGGSVPSPRWSVAGGDEHMLASQRANSPLAHPAVHSAVAPVRAAVVSSTRPDSLFSAGRGGPPAEPAPMAVAPVNPASPGMPPPKPGLAKLAEAAHAAAAAAALSGTRTNRGLSVSAMGGARHKPLPPVPDRLSRTLQAADAAAAAAAITQESLAASSDTVAARPGRAAPPPLPAKARPKIPQALAGDRLSTRAAIAAALERPSSQALFGVGAVRASSQQASLEHMGSAGAPGMHRAATTQPAIPAASASPLGLQAWLQRTDILVPANGSTSAKPAPPLTIAESASMPLERPASQQAYTPRPMTAARRKSMKARSRVVRKVAVPPLPAQEPPPPTLRPASSHSSIHSSASHENGPSQPTTPALAPNSQTVALEHPPMASLSTTTTAQDAYPHPYSHEYEPIQTVSGPTVLSEPPGSELLEPSAPMLLEPTAPELPEQWDIVSPHSYAFPQPMHYETPSAPQYAYGAVPGMAPGHAQMGFALPLLTPPQLHMYATPPPQSQSHTMPLATVSSALLSPALSHQRLGPPKLPEKPRPLLSGGAGRRPMSVPSASRPQSLAHSGMAPTAQAPDRTSAPVSNIGTPLASPTNDYVMVEEDEKARLSAIYNEYQRTEPAASTAAPSREDSARPSRNSSLLAKPPQSPSAPPPLSVNTHAQVPPSAANTAAIADTALAAPTPFVDPAADAASQDALSPVEDPVIEVRDKERQRETKRKAALFELVDTERSYTNDLRMVVELFLLPIQLLGNRKIVDVIFGDMVKITEMNGKMYIDMITRLGPLACKVDPERANRNRRKKKNAIRPSGGSHLSGPSRSVLQGSTLRSPTSPSVSISASTTMSRRLSNSNNQGDQQRSARRSSVHSYSDAAMSLDNMSISQTASRNGDRASVASNGDDLSIATSNSGGSGGDAGDLRYLASATAAGGSTLPAERHDSVRSLGSASEEDENDASKWTEDQVLDYFKNVCIGDVMSNYLKDFSEHYAQYSANHDKAIEYLKLVRESSSRLNLRSDATRDAHQKLLQTLERAEKDTRVRRLRLESFLLSPVQRVMRYPLLLEALLKYTPEDHPDHEDVALALSIAGSVATEVDRKSEELVNRQRLAELQSTFDWAHLLGGVQLKLDTFTKLVGQRKFVRKGPLRKASSGKHLYAILFNDFMMITVSDRRGGVWCYEPYRLPIQTYDLLARDPAKDQFELVNLKNSEVLQLRADTPAEAADWVKDIMKTANYCYDVMCEALTAGIQVSKVKSVISQEAREKILQGGKPAVLSKRY